MLPALVSLEIVVKSTSRDVAKEFAPGCYGEPLDKTLCALALAIADAAQLHRIVLLRDVVHHPEEAAVEVHVVGRAM